MKRRLLLVTLGGVLLSQCGCSDETVKTASEKLTDGGLSGFSSAKKAPPVQTSEFPEPPTNDASEPQRIIRYFCRAWKDEDYKSMYGAMEKNFRKQKSFEAFVSLFESDKEGNGGLKDENIEKKETQEGVAIEMKVELVYRSKRATPKKVVAKTVKTPQGYRVIASGLLPLDLNDL